MEILLLDGTSLDPWARDAKVSVFVFTRRDCPIANRYSPELSRLYQRFSDRGVDFWLVYPDKQEKAATIREHLRAFNVPWTPLMDPTQALVAKAGATTSPEAAVFDSSGRLVYRGRIDDRFPDYGITRPVKEHDLQNAIESALKGETEELVTNKAVGCYLSDLH